MQETVTNLWQIASPVLLGIIGYFLRDLHTKIYKDVSALNSDVAALREEIASLKNSLPLNYVLREDYIRTSANMGLKLDKILDKIHERKGA